VELVLRPASGGPPLDRVAQTLTGGRMTVVATQRGKGVALRVLPDGQASGGRVRVRAMNAAPELARTEVRLGRRLVARHLVPGQASNYSMVPPGTYSLKAARPGGDGGALALRSRVSLAAGTSDTAFVVGTAGEPTRFVVAPDAAVTPKHPPGTGLGGLADGTPWAMALAAAVGAGMLGGLAYLLASWRRRHAA
jgi:hypothetical protein